jgi:GNAT superfamily N-acetyltransferase
MKILAVSDPDAIRKVSRLSEEIWPEHYAPIVGTEQVAYMLQKFQTPEAIAENIWDGTFYYLAQDHGKDVGYFAVRAQEDQNELFLSKIYLRAEERGKGCGRQMLDYVETLARDMKFPKIGLKVHKRNPSVAIYEKMGFKIAGPVIQDIGGGFILDDFKMEKTLS